ncbi:MAG: carbohydrate binding domain-containing protein [Mobilitalea sp.]
MFMKKSKILKKLVTLVLASVFVLSTITSASAKEAIKLPTLNATKKTIVIGQTFNLNVSNVVKNSKFEWSSNNEKVATVNKDNGLVLGVGKGNVKITCKIQSATKKYRVIADFTVLKPAARVTISNPVKTLEITSYYRLKTKLTPASSNDMVTWSTSDKGVANIESDGSFVAKKAGTVIITATTVSGRTDSVSIKVTGKGEVAEDTETPVEVVDEADAPVDSVKVIKEILNENFSASSGRFKARGSAAVAQTTAGIAAEGGKGYIKVSGRTANWNGAISDITDIVIPGATYRVTGWVKYTTGAEVETFMITQDRLSKEDSQWPAVSGPVDVEKNKWTKISGIMVVAPSTTQCQVYFENSNLIDFFVDNVVIEQIEAEIIKEVVVEVVKANVGDIAVKRDFEDGGILDTRAGSVITNTTAFAKSGKASVEVKRTAGWDGAGIKFNAQNKIALASYSGKTVHTSVYVMYKEGPDEVNFKLNNKMEKADDSDNILAQIAVKKGEWTLIEADCFIADSPIGNLIFIETENDGALTFYMDDIEIKVIK